MPISTNTNVKPYYDDFDSDKNFYRVMYKPGFPIQARELTTTQSILQDQIEKLAGVILKEGDAVNSGDFTLGIPTSYVRLASFTQGASANDFVGYTLTGVTSGVKAFVNFATEKTEDDDPTLYVNYESDGNNSETPTFLEGETLESNTPDSFTAVVGVNETSKPVLTRPLGLGSLFSVSEGSYFVDGFIVRNDEQTIALDKYSVSPTCKVGFVVTEEFVDSVDDKSLLDNAQGATNFAAPGADRLKINLTLVKRDVASIDPNFITLANLVQGNLIGNTSQTVKWDWLYDVLAKRTYDESGDYIITDFPIQPMEYWDYLDTDNPNNIEVINFNPDGVFDPDEDGFYPPVPGTGSTEKLTFSEANSKYAIRISPGQAYVQGYEVGHTTPFYIYGNKPRVQGFVDQSSTQIPTGYNIPISRVVGLPNFDNIAGPGSRSQAYKDVITFREFGDGFVGESASSSSPRYGKPYNGGEEPWTVYHLILEEYDEDGISLTVDSQGYNSNLNIDGIRTIPITINNSGFDVLRVYPLSVNESNKNTNSVVVKLPDGLSIKRGDKVDGKNVLISREIAPTPSGIVRPKYLFGTDRVEMEEFYGVNSVSRLGILSSEFFTEFITVFNPETDVNLGRAWEVGGTVIGLQSNAVGQVEKGTNSSGGKLVVSSIVGSFINGEQIMQTFGGVTIDEGFNLLTENGDNIGGNGKGTIEGVEENIDNILTNGYGSSGGPGFANAKTARIIRNGEVISLEFNTTYDLAYDVNEGGTERPLLGDIPRGPINTAEVALFKSLTNNLRAGDYNMVLPSAGDMKSQEEYNEWLYHAIAQIDSALMGNIDGGDALLSSPQSDYDLSQYDLTSPITRSHSGDKCDLSQETYITVSSLGARIVLYKEGSAGVDVGKGGYVYNSNTNSLDLTEFGRNLLYNFPYFNPQQIRKTPRVNYDVITEHGIGGYAVVLPANISNTLTKTKSFYSELADDPNFTADVSLETTQDVNNLTLADGSLFSGRAGKNFLICDDFLGDASDQLVGGDLVTFTDDNNTSQQLIVLFSTQPFGYGPTRVPSYIYFTTTLPNNITGKRVERIRIKSFGKASENLVIQLPENVISSLESDPQNTGINYQVYKEFIVDGLQAGTETVRITTNKPNEKFISDGFKTTIVIAKVTNRNTTNVIGYEGRQLALADDDSIQIANSGTEVTYKLKNPLPTGSVLKIVAPIQVTNAQAKRKVLIRDYQQSFPYDPEFPADPDKSPLYNQAAQLDKADIYRLKSLMLTDDEGKQIDIKDNYVFDNGQRDGYYGLGSLLLKIGRPKPVGNVIATYDYFEHEGSGDFFSVDSYIHDRGVSYGMIPIYRPSGIIPDANLDESDVSLKLRDCVDFRPIVNTTGTNPSVISSITSQTSAIDAINFIGSQGGGNAFVPRIPIPNSQFECDIQFYLPKIDSLFLEKTGKTKLIEGIPSKNPVAPPDLSTGIRLYDLFMPAYSFNMKDIKVEKYNYRRYTMKDISEMDKRLDRVEDLVTLSILEISALNQSVRDSKTGLDRFKNGVIVDGFADHSKGNTGTRGYRCSIDFKQTHLRAVHNWDQIKLQEINQTDDNREVQGFYVNNSGIITSPYDDIDIVSQPKATGSVKIQKVTNFTFEGKVHLQPSVDTFFDNTKIPDVVISDTRVWAAMSNTTADMVCMSLGTVWGSWENQARIGAQKSIEFGKEYQYRENRVNDLTISPYLYSTGLSVGESSISVSRSALSLQEARAVNKRQYSVNTGEPTDTSNGERISDMQIQPTMRTVAVYIKAERLKPNTRYYAFFDEINVSSWVSADKILPVSNFPDGIARYSGVPNGDPVSAPGFGKPLITDDIGNFQGVFLIPNGRPPVVGSKFNGTLSDVEYQTSGPTRSFKTGDRSFRLTSSEVNSTDLAKIEGFAESSFFSGSVIRDKTEFIVSTRAQEFTTQTRINEQQSNTDSQLDSTDVRDLSPIENTSVRPRPRDPIAQTFDIDSNNPDGVFVSEIDLFFKSKDPVQGVELYLVSTDGDTPSNKILPHSRVIKPSSTTIRVTADLGDLSTETIREGLTVRGELSGCVGIIKQNVVIDSADANSNRNVDNTVYDLVISKYYDKDLVTLSGASPALPSAEFIPGEELIFESNIAGTYTIARNEVQLDRIDMTKLGSGYSLGENLTKVEIDAPDLPGGVRAQARIDIAQSTDEVDNIEIESAGAGYTQQSDPSGFVVFDTIAIDSSSVGAGLKVKCRVDKSGKITYAAPQDGGSGYIDGERVRVLDDPNVVITEACILVVRLVEGKNGQIYRAVLTDPGSGYAKVPGVTFIDETKNEKLVPAEAIVRTRPGRKSVNMGVTVSDNATLPTTFRFDAPVYLLGDAKYAFVVKCPTSIDYELYCAKIGQKIIGTETKVVAQPNTGALFTSQKAGNWTEDSSTDLTFVLRRANFKSNFTSNLKLVNEPVGLRLLPPDPIEVCRTLSLFPPRQSNPNSDNWEENDKIVKVYHPNHGLRAGDMVALEGIDGGSSRTIGGINVDNLNTLHQVISADMDYFTIKVIQGATSSLKAGGNRIMGSYNRPYETINLYSGVQTFPSSTLFATNIATEAAGVTQYNNDKQYRQSVVEDIPIMDSFYYDGAKQVANYLNEAKYSQSDLLDGRRSLETNITFSSSDSRVSPVIDLERTSMNVISNLINKPEPNEVALINRMRAAITGPKNNPFTADIAKGTPIDFRLKSGKVVTLIVESVIPELNKMIVVGAGADEVTNFDNVESVNMPSFDMDDLLSLGEITIANNIEYLSEEFNNGTSYSKWFSKQFVLENISDAISVRMSAIFYENTDIRLYFRPRFVGFDGDTGKINWMPFNANAVAPNEQRVDAEGKPIKTPGLPDNIETLIPRSSRNVDSRSIRSDEWQELIWSIQDIAQFDAVSLKIVMEASNPAKCPIIDDLRVVVSE